MIWQDPALPVATVALAFGSALTGDNPTLTLGLSITTFRYVPPDLDATMPADEREEFLNALNTALLTRLQEQGAIYLSNAVIDGRFALRACIVNFRTTAADVDAVVEIVVREGRILAAERK